MQLNIKAYEFMIKINKLKKVVSSNLNALLVLEV